MPLLGSDGGFQADNRGGIIDELGNTIISADTSYDASPLGIAARTQALYGIANANFNLTPPSPQSPIVANQNDLPYWSIENLSDDVMTATTVFDATTQTWGVELNPGTAASGSTLSLTTRSYVLTDDNLALRQKALAVLSKSGTAAVTTQWNLTLTAIYYDSADTALSTAVIGTALDTGTWTSLAGTTTPGGSAINSAAQYVDLTFQLSATAAVTGSAKATIKSLLLTTSSPSTGGGLLIADTFNSSGTWTRPTGVDYLVAVVGIGAGGGGASANVWSSTNNTSNGQGAESGGSSSWFITRNLYVADVASVSVGIGAGGVGAVGTTFIKASAGTARAENVGGATGGSGGATTFGTYFSIPGATGRTGATTVTTTLYDQALLGGRNGVASTSGTVPANNGAAGSATTYSALPYTPTSTAAGTAGGAGSGTVTRAGTAIGTVSGAAGGAAGSAGYHGAGGGGGGAATGSVALGGGVGGNAGAGGAGGGGGGVGAYYGSSLTGLTVNISGGNGGNAAANSGAGGGGGGCAAWNVANTTAYNSADTTVKAGNGGNGADGKIIVLYVA